MLKFWAPCGMSWLARCLRVLCSTLKPLRRIWVIQIDEVLPVHLSNGRVFHHVSSEISGEINSETKWSCAAPNFMFKFFWPIYFLNFQFF